MVPVLAFFGLIFYIPSAFAHHLDDFDARIRSEAKLPAEWFKCKSKDDCGLVSVPCQSDLAVNKDHVDEAREALVKAIPFCLGSSISDTDSVCEHHECLTNSNKDK